MRNIILFLLLITALSSYCQIKNPFLTINYDKVIFYDFEEAGEKGNFILDEKGKPVQSILKQVQLDKITIKKLSTKLGNKQSYGAGTAFCFDPHCGFVYFSKGKPIAQITICLSCNRLYSSIDIPAQKQGKQGKGKDAYYILDGLNKSFRKFINALLIKYKFSHQIEAGSSFDK